MLTTSGIVLLSLVASTRADWNQVDDSAASPTTTGIYLGFYLLLVANFALLLASYVVLIRWLRRAYYNLHQLPGINPEYTDGWAAGAWFVPFLNLSRPYKIMREVWEDTQRAALGQVVEPTTLLGWWWAAWLVKTVIGRITGRMGDSSTASISQADVTGFLIEAVFTFISAWLTWRVIGRAAAFEEQLAIRQAIEKLGEPAPTPLLNAEQSNYELEGGY